MPKKPPRLAAFILRWAIPPKDRDYLLGDYEESFQRMFQEKGAASASLWYWIQLVQTIPEYFLESLYWKFIMFKNYLIIASRNMRKHKVYSFINISGLVLGLACFFLIFLFIQFEHSFDDFHEKRDDIYRVNQEFVYKGDRRISTWTPYEIGRALQEEFPEVAAVARLFRLNFDYILVDNKKDTFFESQHINVDPSFFQIFSFPVIHGDSETFFDSPHSLVISDKVSMKYFGRQDPIGKILNINHEQDFMVSGVVQIPGNTDFPYDFFFPFEAFRTDPSRDWTAFAYRTFVQLHKDIPPKSVARKIWALQEKNVPEEIGRTGLRFQKLSRIHLYRPDGSPGETVKYMIVFGMSGIFILLMACINFMNLSTALAEKRAKEVGLRKTIGAARKQIIYQFYIESFLISSFAFLCALLMAGLFLPVYHQLIGRRLALGLTNSSIIIGMLTAWFITAVVSGSYPALFLSSFRPVQVLKGKFISRSTGSRLRKGLVIFQFSLSVFFIISTITVRSQLKYIDTRYQMIDKEHLVYLRMEAGSDRRGPILKEALLKYPEIQNVTVTMALPISIRYNRPIWSSRSKTPETRLDIIYNIADFDYVKTFNLEIVEGRDFSDKNMTDGINCILNEEAVQELGLQNPVGKEIVYWDEKVGKIIGIVKNFNYQHVNRNIGPLLLGARPDWDDLMTYLVMRFVSGNPEPALRHVRREWKKINPGIPIELHFFDEAFDRIYRNEQIMSKIFLYFALLTILISCLGLFGLSLFMAEQRTKEIGIRKTLGASISNIVGLISKDFLLLVAASNFISWPAALFFMNKWLQNFTYRVNLKAWIFMLSGLIALTMALLTVCYQTVKAATANPVDSLRYE
jgi:ABC-type antimicrobial peptide transport system permease subunit